MDSSLVLTRKVHRVSIFLSRFFSVWGWVVFPTRFGLEYIYIVGGYRCREREIVVFLERERVRSFAEKEREREINGIGMLFCDVLQLLVVPCF